MSASNLMSSGLAISTLLALASCSFSPPGSVLDKPSTGGADAGLGVPDPDPADGGAPVAGDETMSITFTSTEAGGNYSPANVVAAWIEDDAGGFVKTIHRHSAVRTQHLVAWQAMAGRQDTDAVSGATRANHQQPVTATWTIPADMPDGTYTIRLEACDENSATADQNNQGTLTFEKNGTASITNPVDPLFPDITIDYSGRE